MLRSLGGLLLAIAACGGDSTAVPSDSVRRVLFVGNSLTAAWELPALVAELALAAGDTLEVASVTFDGASLDDHLLRGTAEEALRSASWDVAVFQQGPTSTAEGGEQLVEAMERFAPLVRAAGGRPALYMVWPTQDRVAYWDVSAANYTRAATSVDGLLLPAGNAIRRALALEPAAPLFELDGFHPSAEGAYLAAITIAATLTGRAPDRFPGTVRWGTHRLEIPDARLDLYRRAARDALER